MSKIEFKPEIGNEYWIKARLLKREVNPERGITQFLFELNPFSNFWLGSRGLNVVSSDKVTAEVKTMSNKELKSKRCKMFKHVWSRDVFMQYGSCTMILKVCLDCQRIKKSKFHIMTIEDVDPSKIESMITKAMALEGIPYKRDNSNECH